MDIPITSLPSLLLGDDPDALPDTPAYIDTENPEVLRLSWREFAYWCKRVAAGLVDTGLCSNDRVLIYSGNNIFFPVATLGVIMAGGIISTANPTFVARELAYQLKDSGARFLLIAEASMGMLLETTAWEMGSAVHPHPTLAEAVGEAALAVDGKSINF